jgi:hypothetical protein
MCCVRVFLPQNLEHLRYDNTAIFLKASIDYAEFKFYARNDTSTFNPPGGVDSRRAVRSYRPSMSPL